MHEPQGRCYPICRERSNMPVAPASSAKVGTKRGGSDWKRRRRCRSRLSAQRATILGTTRHKYRAATVFRPPIARGTSVEKSRTCARREALIHCFWSSGSRADDGQAPDGSAGVVLRIQPSAARDCGSPAEADRPIVDLADIRAQLRPFYSDAGRRSIGPKLNFAGVFEASSLVVPVVGRGAKI